MEIVRLDLFGKWLMLVHFSNAFFQSQWHNLIVSVLALATSLVNNVQEMNPSLDVLVLPSLEKTIVDLPMRLHLLLLSPREQVLNFRLCLRALEHRPIHWGLAKVIVTMMMSVRVR